MKLSLLVLLSMLSSALAHYHPVSHTHPTVTMDMFQVVHEDVGASCVPGETLFVDKDLYVSGRCSGYIMFTPNERVLRCESDPSLERTPCLPGPTDMHLDKFCYGVIERGITDVPICQAREYEVEEVEFFTRCGRRVVQMLVRLISSEVSVEEEVKDEEVDVPQRYIHNSGKEEEEEEEGDHHGHHGHHHNDYSRPSDSDHRRRQRVITNTRTVLIGSGIFCVVLSLILLLRACCVKRRRNLENLRRPLLCFDACRSMRAGAAAGTIVLGTPVVVKEMEKGPEYSAPPVVGVALNLV